MPTGGTIAAICTPPGNAARAMVRVSGKQALHCAHDLCNLRDPQRGVFKVKVCLDSATLPAIAMWFPKGTSYAGQSTLELVVTFLALLELIRQQVAHAIQEQNFGEIVVAIREVS